MGEIPRRGLQNALLGIEFRAVAEQLLGFRDIGLGVGDIALALGTVDGFDIGDGGVELANASRRMAVIWLRSVRVPQATLYT